MKTTLLFRSKLPVFIGIILLFFATQILADDLSYVPLPDNAGDGPHGMTNKASAITYKGNIWLFMQSRSKSKHLEYRVRDDRGNWMPPARVPNVKMKEGPSAVVHHNKIYVFHRGTEDREGMYYVVFDGKKWSEDKKINNVKLNNCPSAVVYNDKIYVFHQGYNGDERIYYFTFDENNEDAKDIKLAVSCKSMPAAVTYNNKIYLFHTSSDGKRDLFYSSFDGSNWSNSVRTAIKESYGPDPVVYRDKIYIFHQDPDKKGKMQFAIFNGSKFERTGTFDGVEMSVSPTSVAHNNQLYTFYQYKEEKGYVWYTYYDGSVRHKGKPLGYFSYKEDGLLDKKFGTFTIPATHNSFIADPLFISGNHSHSEGVPYQLRQGIRYIELDINNVDFPWNANIEKSVAIVHGNFWGSTVFGQRNVRFGIMEIRDFLNEYPDEMILLKIDSPSKVSLKNLEYFFKTYGIYDKIYMEQDVNLFDLTPRDILKKGKQIIVTAVYDNAGYMESGILKKWTHNVTTGLSEDMYKFDAKAKSNDFDAKPYYGVTMTGSKPTIGFGSPDRQSILNKYSFCKPRLIKGWRESGRRPFTLIIDFSSYGEVMEVLREMNFDYNSVRGAAKDENGKVLKDVKYTVSYSSDGKTETAMMQTAFDFPAHIGESITITPSLPGVTFSPSSFTYNNTSNEDMNIDFKVVRNSNTKSQGAEGTITDQMEDKEMIRFFPNPFKDELHLSFQEVPEGNTSVKMYNLQGQLMLKKEIDESSSSIKSIDISTANLPKGAYIYKVTSGRQELKGKLMKE